MAATGAGAGGLPAGGPLLAGAASAAEPGGAGGPEVGSRREAGGRAAGCCVPVPSSPPTQAEALAFPAPQTTSVVLSPLRLASGQCTEMSHGLFPRPCAGGQVSAGLGTEQVSG